VDTVQSTSLGPGLVAFLIVVFLAVATVALWYSMVRHLRKVPKTFDAPLGGGVTTDQVLAEGHPGEADGAEAAHPEGSAPDDDQPPTVAT
jgi:hypothetical protein